MTQSEFLEELALALNEDVENITLDVALETYEGWDSTGVLGVVALLDGLLDYPLEVERLQECRTIKDLVGIIDCMLQ